MPTNTKQAPQSAGSAAQGLTLTVPYSAQRARTVARPRAPGWFGRLRGLFNVARQPETAMPPRSARRHGPEQFHAESMTVRVHPRPS